MIKNLLAALLVFGAIASYAQTRHKGFRENIPLDSIILSDPAILPDEATQTYYMTGTGGLLWKSKDLKLWTGPYDVAQPDPESWMGPHPAIWAAELHKYKGKYFYFATFTNRDVVIDTVRGNKIERRASHILVSDKPEGQYKPMNDSIYLPADKPTLDGTFWIDNDGEPYMVYCYEWLQNWDGTIEKIRLKPDLGGSIGEGKVLFRASDSPWSREKENGKIRSNKVTDGPWLFRTATGKLGMLWTSWIFDVYTQGVAYSLSGTLDGPWVQEKEPITPPNYGHGMLFKTFDGKWMMSVHSHAVVDGKYRRIPTLFNVDLSGDKLIVKDSQGLSATPNQPLGEGKGIFPGRVVWTMDPDVAKWDGKTGRWWDEGNIDQTLLENMYEKTLCALAGTKNVKTAWKQIFTHQTLGSLEPLKNNRSIAFSSSYKISIILTSN